MVLDGVLVTSVKRKVSCALTSRNMGIPVGQQSTYVYVFDYSIPEPNAQSSLSKIIREGCREQITENRKLDFLLALEEYPHNTISIKCNMSHSLVLKPVKTYLYLYQMLLDNDFNKRMEFYGNSQVHSTNNNLERLSE